ncbi:MAG: hypothetical protein FJY66_04300 [Calditrichaeota bacterium]|nr:hypothetical protein [Calditrichota bacterium]
MRVRPFTRTATSSPFDDFKHFAVSKEAIPVPESGVLTLEAEFVVQCWNHEPYFLRDAMAGFFLCSLRRDLFLGAVSNGTVAGALCLTTGAAEEEAVGAIAEAWRRLAPGQRHRYTLQYERNIDKISFWLDKKLFYSVRGVPAKMNEVSVGLALLTLNRAGQPLHEQGAELQLGPIEILET